MKFTIEVTPTEAAEATAVLDRLIAIRDGIMINPEATHRPARDSNGEFIRKGDWVRVTKTIYEGEIKDYLLHNDVEVMRICTNGSVEVDIPRYPPSNGGLYWAISLFDELEKIKI